MGVFCPYQMAKSFVLNCAEKDGELQNTPCLLTIVANRVILVNSFFADFYILFFFIYPLVNIFKQRI